MARSATACRTPHLHIPTLISLPFVWRGMPLWGRGNRVPWLWGDGAGRRTGNPAQLRDSTVSGGEASAVPLATYRMAYHLALRLRPRAATRVTTVRHATCIAPPRIATRLDRVIRSPQAPRTALRPHVAVASQQAEPLPNVSPQTVTPVPFMRSLHPGRRSRCRPLSCPSTSPLPLTLLSFREEAAVVGQHGQRR